MPALALSSVHDLLEFVFLLDCIIPDKRAVSSRAQERRDSVAAVKSHNTIRDYDGYSDASIGVGEMRDTRNTLAAHIMFSCHQSIRSKCSKTKSGQNRYRVDNAYCRQ